MKDRNWSYLAGIIDGEGNIGLSKKNIKRETFSVGCEVCITNCNHDLMKWLVRNFGGQYYMRKARDVQKHADSYIWRVTGRKNRETILLGILPYLIIKKNQAQIALEFLRLNGSHCPENASQEAKIESDLTGDSKSAPLVTEAA